MNVQTSLPSKYYLKFLKQPVSRLLQYQWLLLTVALSLLNGLFYFFNHNWTCRNNEILLLNPSNSKSLKANLTGSLAAVRPKVSWPGFIKRIQAGSDFLPSKWVVTNVTTVNDASFLQRFVRMARDENATIPAASDRSGSGSGWGNTAAAGSGRGRCPLIGSSGRRGAARARGKRQSGKMEPLGGESVRQLRDCGGVCLF